jgi:hypothetical protein
MPPNEQAIDDTQFRNDPIVLLGEHGSVRKAAAAAGIPASTFQMRLARAKAKEFTLTPLPSSDRLLDDLISERVKAFERKQTADTARKLIPIAIHLDGPIGVMHQGDPHIDDDGCNMPRLLRDVELCNVTPGLFAGNVGDFTNNWIGRLERLNGAQSIKTSEAWKLAAWYVNAQRLIYMIGGNHDAWSGDRDPLQYIAAGAGNQYEPHGARLALNLPNGRQIRINARHDHRGHSMWNPAHGPGKAAQIGPDDHIFVSGHKHVFGSGWHRKPSGLWCCALRVGAYKSIDGYAHEGGFPEHNIPSIVTLIFPDAGEEGLIEVIKDVDRAADFLTWARKRHASGKSATRRDAVA